MRVAFTMNSSAASTVITFSFAFYVAHLNENGGCHMQFLVVVMDRGTFFFSTLLRGRGHDLHISFHPLAVTLTQKKEHVALLLITKTRGKNDSHRLGSTPSNVMEKKGFAFFSPVRRIIQPQISYQWPPPANGEREV